MRWMLQVYVARLYRANTKEPLKYLFVSSS